MSKYGAVRYGAGLYGQGSSVATVFEATTWAMDNFGEFLVAVSDSDGRLYKWEGDPNTPAAIVTEAPEDNAALVVTAERFLFLLGADGNIRKVQWPSQETLTDYTPTPVNSAGDFELATQGRLMAGRRARQGTLLFTDADLWLAEYIGGTLIYSFSRVGDQCGVISKRAMSIFDTEAMWMGKESFYKFDGFVQPIPCDVHDRVFNNFNRLQAAKVWSMTVAQFGEVWWFYPSATSMEVDRYVVYNKFEKTWSTGALARTAGLDAGATQNPIMVTPAGLVMEHEVGDDRDDEVPFLESGPVKLDAGDRVMDVLGYIPDEKTLGDTQLELVLQYEPMSDEETVGPFSANDKTDLRTNARQVRLKITQAEETDWRIGTPALLVRPAGER